MKVIIDGKLVDGGSGGGGGGGGTTPALTDVLTSGNGMLQSQAITDLESQGSENKILEYKSGKWLFHGRASYPYPTNTIPKVDSGSGNVGSETDKFARGDHVHPTDTSRASVSSIRYDVSSQSNIALLDRTINKYTGSGSSVTFTIPSFSTNPAKCLDLVVDIDNTANVNDLLVDFSDYGTRFWIATTEQYSSVPLTISAGKYVRVYITQASFTVSDDTNHLPVLQIENHEVYIHTPGLYTTVAFKDGTTQVLNVSETFSKQALIDAGIYGYNEDYGDNTWLKEVQSVDIGRSVTKLGKDLFRDCSTLQSVTHYDTITEIGDSAFASCNDLETFTIPSSVTKIDSEILSYTSVTSAVIPSTLTSLSEYAFSQSGFESVIIRNSFFSDHEFYASSLVTVDIQEKILVGAPKVFTSCGLITSVTFHKNTMEEVQGLLGYPWGLKEGTPIICSDGTLYAPKGGSGSS